MIETEDRAMARSIPTHADLERAIESVPGVAEAHVTRVGETGKSRLRIRLASDEDAGSVSWSIAATLRERFGISLDPDQIRPRAVATPLTGAGSAADTSGTVGGPTDDAEVVGIGATHDAADDPGDDASAGEGGVIVAGDRVLLSEAARALLEDAVAEAREADGGDDADLVDAAATGNIDAAAETDATGGTDVTADSDDTADTDATGGTDVTADSDDTAGSDATADTDVTAGSDATAETDATGDIDVTADIDAAAETDATGDTDVTADTDATDPTPMADVRALSEAQRHRDDGTRARIRHLDTRVDISDVEVTATLGFGDREVTRSVRAVATEQGILRAVAEATLHALSELTGERLVAGVDSVAASVSGEPPIATVIVSIVTDRGDEALLGSSLVRKDPQRAVMRATLDALNRRVEPWLEVEIAG